MLYKFKSKAAGDLIMLEPNGRRVLEIIGKEPGPRGIIQRHEMAAAVESLRQAAAHDEAEREALVEQVRGRGEDPPALEAVTLRHRVMPMIEMLQRCGEAGADIVWGV